MNYSPLKKLRISVFLTQTQVANSMGVSQPKYQRWESGETPVPANKIKKLAKILETTTDNILGSPRRFDFFGIDSTVEDADTYYCRVAVHFVSGHGSLLFPVSVGMRDALHKQLDAQDSFIIAESLDNRMVYIRRASIADVYFSDDACDDDGPETYDNYVGVFPDEDFWQIAEWIDKPEFIESKHSSARRQTVFNKILLTDEQLDKYVAAGEVSEDERNETRKAADENKERFINRATSIIWQLSSGRIRQECNYDNEVLFDAFCRINNNEDDFVETIYLPLSGYHRTIFISKAALDYITIPAHKFNKGKLISDEREIDEE